MSNTPKLRFKEFSGDWEKTTLKHVTDSFEYGMNSASAEFDGENKYIRITDIDETTSKYINTNVVSPLGELEDKYLVKENDILFARTGASTGKTYLYDKKDGKLYFAGFLIRANVNNDNNAKFIFLQTKTKVYDKWVKVMSMRSGQPGINSQEYASYSFNTPSKEEQEKIASFFSLIDDKISLQGEKVEALKDYKKGIMQKIFSKELRFKDDNGKDYPEWEEKKLGDFTKLMQSGLSRKLSNKDIGIPVIRSNNLIDGKIDVSDIKYWHSIDDQGVKLENYFLRENDLLVNFINSLAQIGKCSIYTDELKRNTIFTTNIMRLNFEHDIDVNYIFNYFQLKKYNDYIRSITKPAVNQASFTTADFKRFKVDLPNIEEQIKIGKLLKMLDSKIEKEQEKLDSLNEYKKGLLQQMFV
ncbi:restriction endonuclease subunit S [Peptacetobacter sp.]|uniref:restriction endonuclease subunit S n=1 Tax=Peptacetobacter sp. TaxID=2991975 RepID=UPI0026131559|nr:restriction endonuclease subunit S [Peptacetobacter sp.]